MYIHCAYTYIYIYIYIYVHIHVYIIQEGEDSIYRFIGFIGVSCFMN